MADMIKLKLNYEPVPNMRIIQDVLFVDGVAELPPNMKAKAISICKFYNVKAYVIEGDYNEEPEEDAGPEDDKPEASDEE